VADFQVVELPSDGSFGQNHLLADGDVPVVVTWIVAGEIVEQPPQPLQQVSGGHRPGGEAGSGQQLPRHVADFLEVGLLVPRHLGTEEKPEIAQRNTRELGQPLGRSLTEKAAQCPGDLAEKLTLPGLAALVALENRLDVGIGVQHELENGAGREVDPEQAVQGGDGLLAGDEERQALPDQAEGVVGVEVDPGLRVAGDPGKVVGKLVPAGLHGELPPGQPAAVAEQKRGEPHQFSSPASRVWSPRIQRGSSTKR
jgi:hypothetical protein